VFYGKKPAEESEGVLLTFEKIILKNIFLKFFCKLIFWQAF
jgi:hypothetical protein